MIKNLLLLLLILFGASTPVDASEKLAAIGKVAQAIPFPGPGRARFVPACTQINSQITASLTDALSTWANVTITTGAFDTGTQFKLEANSSAANNHGAAPVGTNFLAADFGSTVAFPITKFQIDGPSNNGLLRGGGASVSATFDGSLNGSTWTNLTNFTTSGGSSQSITCTDSSAGGCSSTIAATSTFRFYRFSAPGNGTNGSAISRFQFYYGTGC